MRFRSTKLSNWLPDHASVTHIALVFTICIGSALSRPQEQNANLDPLLQEVFGPPTVQKPQNSPSQRCTCVPYYMCADSNLKTDAEGNVTVQRQMETEDLCSDALEVCCKSSNEPSNPIKLKPLVSKRCGIRNEEGIDSQIKGNFTNEAQFGEFPWMIGILVQSGSKLIYRCGGALIHPQLVLTAAHCVSGNDLTINNVTARAGEWDSKNKNEIYPHQEQIVKEIIIHEEFVSGSLYNDVALLYLEQPFAFAENVGIVCLPKNIDDISNSKNCFASGWGKDKFDRNGVYREVLKKVELPIVDSATCQNQLRTTLLGKFFNLHDSFVCAGGIPEKDTCKGDGGSPLVCPVPDRLNTYYQVGIVAWGIECGKNIPAVYVNVAHFKDWIDTSAKKYNLTNFEEYNY